MAVSCLDVVNGALRKIRVLASGREARQPDRDDTMEALRGLYRAWINQGAFGRLKDVVGTGQYKACENERIMRIDDTLTSITLPQTINGYHWNYNLQTDELTLDAIQDAYGDYILDDEGNPIESGNDDPEVTGWGAKYEDVRPPRDCSVVVINDTTTGETADFLYDGHQKKWFALNALKLTDEAPLGFRDPDGLKACLAAQISDEFGAQLGPMATRQALSFQNSLTTRFSMPRVETAGVYF